PEVVKNEPYGEKADIWALGCIVYQMAALEPPFYSNNMLSLANKIVEAIYEPLEDGIYSERVEDMITWCLSPNPERRPDIVAVGSRIADLMMRHMDALYASHYALEKRAERDRKRAQRYFLEGCRSGNSCCRSFPTQHNKSNPVDVMSSFQTCFLKCFFVSFQGGFRDSEGESEIRYVLNVILNCNVDFENLNLVWVSNLRQIEDPVHKLLVQLHKVLYITQLPPASRHNVKRRLVERFKKSLFQFGSDPHNLKTELSKVGHRASIWTTYLLSYTKNVPLMKTIVLLSPTGDILREGVTYEQMQVEIELLL
uniref:NIMA related kinase 10 n=1 Tax=Hippocampus comes TaxID=109280 RepID=A0A3Q2XVU3_HIPCM